MPLCTNSYADKVAYNQSQCDPFQECSSIDEVLDAYYGMVLWEHKQGVDSDPLDPNYFLEYVQEAKDLKKAWALSGKQENVFLELSQQFAGNCFELAEIIVSGNYCDLCF